MGLIELLCESMKNGSKKDKERFKIYSEMKIMSGDEYLELQKKDEEYKKLDEKVRKRNKILNKLGIKNKNDI